MITNKEDIGLNYYNIFLEGNEKGLEKLVELYNNQLILFINKYVNDLQLSEDIAAETFCELLIKKSRFVKKYSFKTWLFRIGRNNAIDYVRKNKIKNSFFEERDISNLTSNITNEQLLLNDEFILYLHKKLNELKREYKDVLYLLYFENMSYEEMMVVLNKNYKQIKNLCYCARISLKQILEKDGYI